MPDPVDSQQQTRQIRLRRAVEADAYVIAQLVDLSNEGLDETIWRQQMGDETDPFRFGEMLVLDPRNPVHFGNTIIAEVDGAVAGMLVIVKLGDPYPDTDPALLPDYARPSFILLRQAAGFGYLRNMAVFDAYRGLNLASLMIDTAISTLERIGAPGVCAIIRNTNQIMKAMYDKRGLKLVDEIDTSVSPLYPEGLTLRLMKKNLGSNSQTNHPGE